MSPVTAHTILPNPEPPVHRGALLFPPAVFWQSEGMREAEKEGMR